MYKRGQAASEFLLTYGFAILVVLVAVAAISYVGVYGNKGLIPTKCTFLNPLPCVDGSLNSSNDLITIALRNNNGFSVDILNYINIESECPGGYSISKINGLNPNVTIANNEIAKIEIICIGLNKGKFKSDIGLRYHNRGTGLIHDHLGEIVASVS